MYCYAKQVVLSESKVTFNGAPNFAPVLNVKAEAFQSSQQISQGRSSTRTMEIIVRVERFLVLEVKFHRS